MLKKLFIILIILSSVLVPMTILRIDQKESQKNRILIQNKNEIAIRKTISIEKPIGYLNIPQISLNKPLYDKTSKKNNIEENVTILQESEYPEKENSILFIAAHSGTGEIAFFNRLDELKIGDKITLSYLEKTYHYQINNIYEEPKDGYIRGIKENKRQLVLTTCCPKKDNCQLIINCIEKES